MKTLYFDCGMGAAGDMLMASLYEICPDKAGFLLLRGAKRSSTAFRYGHRPTPAPVPEPDIVPSAENT